jgi:hypothetical protein
MKNARPVLGLEQGWQFGLEGLILQIIKFYFDARVSAFESLGALLPDSPHLSLWVDMQDLNYSRCWGRRQKRCETGTKKKRFAIHWFGGGELLASKPTIIP